MNAQALSPFSERMHAALIRVAGYDEEDAIGTCYELK